MTSSHQNRNITHTEQLRVNVEELATASRAHSCSPARGAHAGLRSHPRLSKSTGNPCDLDFTPGLRNQTQSDSTGRSSSRTWNDVHDTASKQINKGHTTTFTTFLLKVARLGIPGWRSGLARAFGPERDPGDPGSNPTSGSRCMEPASPSACVSASLSLSLSVTIINKKILKKMSG